MITSASCLTGRGYPGIEDEENWHGKALGAKAAESVEACKKLIQNPGPHGLQPLDVIDDAPNFQVPQITLSEPPNYKLGDKVRELIVAIGKQLLVIHVYTRL